MDHLLTLQRANVDHLLTLQHIYIYVYIFRLIIVVRTEAFLIHAYHMAHPPKHLAHVLGSCAMNFCKNHILAKTLTESAQVLLVVMSVFLLVLIFSIVPFLAISSSKCLEVGHTLHVTLDYIELH